MKSFKNWKSEKNWAKMMRSVRRKSEANPWVVVAVEFGEFKGQSDLIKTPEVIPAEWEHMKREYPYAQLYIEDGTGNVVWIDKN